MRKLTLALVIFGASCAHAGQEKLTVSGVSEQHFTELSIDAGGMLHSSGLEIGTVAPNGSVSFASRFTGKSIANARIKFSGQDVAKLNAAGNQVLTMAGLPVLPGWVKSLTAPKPGPATSVMTTTMNSGARHAEYGEGRAANAAPLLRIEDFRLKVGLKYLQAGIPLVVPAGNTSVSAEYRVGNPSAVAVEYDFVITLNGEQFKQRPRTVAAQSGNTASLILKTVTVEPGKPLELEAIIDLTWKGDPRPGTHKKGAKGKLKASK